MDVLEWTSRTPGLWAGVGTTSTVEGWYLGGWAGCLAGAVAAWVGLGAAHRGLVRWKRRIDEGYGDTHALWIHAYRRRARGKSLGLSGWGLGEAGLAGACRRTLWWVQSVDPTASGLSEEIERALLEAYDRLEPVDLVRAHTLGRGVKLAGERGAEACARSIITLGCLVATWWDRPEWDLVERLASGGDYERVRRAMADLAALEGLPGSGQRMA